MTDQPIEARLHLCESCAKVYPECDATREGMVFGCGVGNDNVIGCDAYENKFVSARVIALNEVNLRIFGKQYIIETVEYGDGTEPYLVNGLFFDKQIDGKYRFATVDRHIWLLDKDYGKTWRCWTKKPSDEERKAVKWE